MRLIGACTAVFLASASWAVGQTTEQVKTDILSALATPLPITVIGPVMAQDVKVTESGGAFQAELVNPMLMGIVPLGNMSFKLTPQGATAYHITDFKLPSKIDLMNMATLEIGNTTFDGVWATDTRSYQTLKFELAKVAVKPKGMPDARVTVGSLALDVAKEGQAGATESNFRLSAKDIASTGLPPNNIAVKNVKMQLQANGETPVDLYSVVSRFAVLSMMQPDSNALIQFAEGLRAQTYDTAQFDVTADGIDVADTTPGSNIHMTVDQANAVMGLTGVTPDEWGKMTLAIDTRGINDKGLLDVLEMKTESASLNLEGDRIPVGATLNAITKMQAMSRGESVSFKVSEVLDGLLNMGSIKLKSSAAGIAYVPKYENDPTIRFDSFTFESGTDGFRDDKGRITFATSADGLNIQIKRLPTMIEAKAYALFNPRTIKYDVAFSELNTPLLRKLLGDVTMSTEQDYAALAVPALTYVMALKPRIETRDMHFASTGVDMSLSSDTHIYPAWMLSAMPYEGVSKLSIKGLDAISTFIEELKVTPSDQGGYMGADTSGITVLQSVVQTFRALATADGDRLAWNMSFPKAGEGMFKVNDVELRFPDLMRSLAPMAMFGLGSGMPFGVP